MHLKTNSGQAVVVENLATVEDERRFHHASVESLVIQFLEQIFEISYCLKFPGKQKNKKNVRFDFYATLLGLVANEK